MLGGFIVNQLVVNGVVSGRNVQQLENMMITYYTVFVICIGVILMLFILPFIHFMQGQDAVLVGITMLYSMVLTAIIFLFTLGGISKATSIRDARGKTESINHKNLTKVKMYRFWSLLILGLMTGVLVYFCYISLSGNHWRYAFEEIVFIIAVVIIEWMYSKATSSTINKCGELEKEEREQVAESKKKVALDEEANKEDKEDKVAVAREAVQARSKEEARKGKEAKAIEKKVARKNRVIKKIDDRD